MIVSVLNIWHWVLSNCQLRVTYNLHHADYLKAYIILLCSNVSYYINRIYSYHIAHLLKIGGNILQRFTTYILTSTTSPSSRKIQFTNGGANFIQRPHIKLSTSNRWKYFETGFATISKANSEVLQLQFAFFRFVLFKIITIPFKVFVTLSRCIFVCILACRLIRTQRLGLRHNFWLFCLDFTAVIRGTCTRSFGAPLNCFQTRQKYMPKSLKKSVSLLT